MDLPNIFQTLITDFRPALRNAEPANALYMLTRFACLNCDDNWVEDLIIGATDAIEDVFFVSHRTSREKRDVVLSNRIAESCRGPHLPNLLAVQHHGLATSYALRQSDQPDVRNPRFFVVNRGDLELCLRYVCSCLASRSLAFNASISVCDPLCRAEDRPTPRRGDARLQSGVQRVRFHPI